MIQSAGQVRVRIGVLTDDRACLLRWTGAVEVSLACPDAFGPEGWFSLYEWLRNLALISLEGVSPDREGIPGPNCPAVDTIIT
jgi:hypothetical protein